MNVLPRVLVAFMVIAGAVCLSAPVRAESRTETIMLLPMADETGAAWTAGGLCTNQFECIDDPVPHDVDASYITANPATPGSVNGSFQIGNLPPRTFNISRLTIFAWARSETVPPVMWDLALGATTGPGLTDVCLPGAGVISPIYLNGSVQYDRDCGGNEWTVDTANAMIVWLNCTDDGVPPADDTCRVTSAGVVVEYAFTTSGMEGRDYLGWILALAMLVLGLMPSPWLRPFLLLAGFIFIVLAITSFGFLNPAPMVLGVGAGIMFIALGAVMLLSGGTE